jgi:hypothetical protein
MNNLKFHMRRIVEVVSYWDEEREIPWNYVRRTGDGRFEAIATHLFDALDRQHDEPRGEARERLIGVFDARDAAVAALREYLRRVKDAEDRDWKEIGEDGLPTGRFNFNWTTH